MTTNKNEPAAHEPGNRVRLRGRISTAPEERSLPSGTMIVTLRLSVPRDVSPMTEGSRQSADWVDCSAWGGKARRTASGVVVGSERDEKGGVVAWVVTNAHAVEMGDLKAPRLVVIVDDRGDSTEYGAQVVATGSVPDMDLALLKVPGLPLAPAQLAPDLELELGDDVVVAASPFGRALSLSGGMVSHVEWDKKSKLPLMLKTDAPIGYGASGGGIFSLETGRLLAIVEGYRTAKVDFAVEEQSYSFDVPMPGETFAAPSAKVRQFLQAQGFGRLIQRGPQAEGGVAQAAGR